MRDAGGSFVKKHVSSPRKSYASATCQNTEFFCGINRRSYRRSPSSREKGLEGVEQEDSPQTAVNPKLGGSSVE